MKPDTTKMMASDGRLSCCWLSSSAMIAGWRCCRSRVWSCRGYLSWAGFAMRWVGGAMLGCLFCSS